ncbi:MAG: hypothetical protein ACRDQ0_13295 [Pseudonocardia sp.]
MSAWSWGSTDAIRIVVTATGADGERRSFLRDLRAGHDHAETIRLPEGTCDVTVERPRRIRIDLGVIRARRQVERNGP